MRRGLWVLLVAALGTLAALAAGTVSPARAAGRAWQDRLQPSGRVDERLVVVAVDNRTHDEIGWLPAQSGVERGLGGMAELLAVLQTHDPALVVLDPWSRSALQGFEGGVPVLGEALRSSGPVALVAEPGRSSAEFQAAAAVAQRGLIRDEDSVVRYIGLLNENNPGQTSSQPLAGLAAAILADDLPPSLTADERSLRIGERRIPVAWTGPPGENRAALTRIRYHDDLAPGGARVISAADVLQGRVEPGALQGKVIVAGMTMARDLELVPTPAGRTDVGDRSVPAMAPTFVLANALNTLLTEQYIVPVPDRLMIAAIAALALLVAAGCYLGPLWAAPLVAGVAGGGWYLVVRLAFGEGWLLSIIRPETAVAVTFVAAVAVRGLGEVRARRRLNRLFATYVPAAVARQLVQSGRAEIAAAGERLRVTILFCDLRGFTPLAARLEPGDLRRLLERFYEDLSAIVFAHGGTVLQYTGDEIFAVFGAPLPTSDHPLQAVRSAVEILEAAPAVNAALEAEDLPTIAYGIGVNTGDVVAAHVGSVQRKQYSIMGDPVNICARLCSSAKAGQAVISADTLDAIDAEQRPPTTSIGELELKGVNRPITAYRIGAATPVTDLAAAGGAWTAPTPLE